VSDDRLSLQARNVRFDRTGLPVHRIPGEPFATHLLDVLHLFLPAGERWFVEVFSAALPMVRDAALAVDVRGFIGQWILDARALDAAGGDTACPGRTALCVARAAGAEITVDVTR
jgi:uncharacterized protein